MVPPGRNILAAAMVSAATFVFFWLRLSEDWLDSSSLTSSNLVVHGPFGNRPFKKVYVHLDLKGAPPRLSYLRQIFPLFRQMEIDGVFIEYENVFPYSGELTSVVRHSHYSVEEIHQINEIASINNLELIPLIQTFGHMEFILKFEKFSHLAESKLADDSICPSDHRSIDLIKEMIRQITRLHPNSSSIHIGCDEAYHVAEDFRCQKELDKLGDRPRSVEKLKLRHIARVAQMARDANFSTVYAWNDMFDKSSVADIRSAGLGNLITPIVWGYAEDVRKPGYFPEGLFYRLAAVFPQIWFGSAFKGANGANNTFISIDRYLRNQKSYVRLYQEFSQPLSNRVNGIVITGWQRYKHYFPLCELLPVSLPSLGIVQAYLTNLKRSNQEINSKAKDYLSCGDIDESLLSPVTFGNDTYYVRKEILYSNCAFPGASIYKSIMVDLRFVTWKVNHITSMLESSDALLKEIVDLKDKLSRDLLLIYYEEDVDEFINQNLVTLEQLLTNLTYH